MFPLDVGTVLAIGFAVAVIIVILKTARIVPQRTNYVVERLGRYNRTLDSGFHLLIPFIDKVAYQHTLKEEVIDVVRPRQLAHHPTEDCRQPRLGPVNVAQSIHRRASLSHLSQPKHKHLPAPTSTLLREPQGSYRHVT